MLTSTNSRFLQLFVGTSLLLGAAVSSARSMPASAGRPVANDLSCFGMNGSSMANICATNQSFELPLVVDNAGAKTVSVAAFGPTPANNVCCAAVGVSFDFRTIGSSALQCLPSFGTTQLITLSGAFVPANGYLFANCKVDPGGRIHDVLWND